MGVFGDHPYAGRRVDRPAFSERPGDQLDGGIRVDVLFLHVLRHVGRDPGLGPGDEQPPLARQVGEKVGNEVAEDVRVGQDPLAVTGDGGAQCLVRLSLRV